MEKRLNFCEFVHTWNRECPMYEIYQIKAGSASERLRFMDTEYIERQGMSVNGADYDIKYAAPLSCFEGKKTLDSIFAELNMEQPFDYRGISPSVSDVIVIRTSDSEEAFFIERFGFRQLQDFLTQREGIQDPFDGFLDDVEVNEAIARRNLYLNQAAAFYVKDCYFEIQDMGKGMYQCSFFDCDFNLEEHFMTAIPDHEYSLGSESMFLIAREVLAKKGLSLRHSMPVSTEVLHEHAKRNTLMDQEKYIKKLFDAVDTELVLKKDYKPGKPDSRKSEPRRSGEKKKKKKKHMR